MPVVPFILGTQNDTVVTSYDTFDLRSCKLLIKDLDHIQLSQDREDSNISYDLQVGSQYRDYRSAEAITLRAGDEFPIPPGRTFLIQTHEYVHLPEGLFGLILPKVSKLQEGLSTVASKVDPGYHGNLIITVFNHGLEPVKLKSGGKLCNMMMLHVGDGAKPYRKPPQSITGRGNKGLLRQIRIWADNNLTWIALAILVAMSFSAIANLIRAIRYMLALRLTHIPTEVADGVSFRAHEGGHGRRHAKGQAARQARSRERSAS